ncbi:hypothetical protein P5673_011622 [Acropora cervicornis]|uniref:Uncharacterized protein n=1 Tax=Acropora cervicornis TaxID=6130 RepID=A0AAD9QPG5_ACRCE|nr:hypothetical protein P5673_011622 [Acropora cervicornis]
MAMDNFETISLDSKQCKICNQETGEELISCILREKFSSGGNVSPGSPKSPETSLAHRVCLERWDAIMKRTFFPQQKKTWKDRVKGLVSTRSSNNNVVKTWTQVDFLDHAGDGNRSILEPTKREIIKRSSWTSENSVFRESKEKYRVENVGKAETEFGEWRRNKVRICSVDEEDDEKEATFSSTHTVTRHTRTKLQACNLAQLMEFANNLTVQINEVSSDLITHLQARDDLLLQKHTMKVTAGQLVDLQLNLKTASTQNLQRPAPDKKLPGYIAL